MDKQLFSQNKLSYLNDNKSNNYNAPNKYRIYIFESNLIPAHLLINLLANSLSFSEEQIKNRLTNVNVKILPIISKSYTKEVAEIKSIEINNYIHNKGYKIRSIILMEYESC